MNQQFSRRNFLRSAGFAAAAISAPGFLAACGGSSGESARPASLDPNKSYTDAEQLAFNGWGFQVDMVQKWVTRFNEQNKENSAFRVVAGTYPSVMENKYRNKEKVDLAYVLDTAFPRWAQANWIHDFSDFPDLEKAKAAMYPNVRDALTIDGKMYGLPYFTSIDGTIAVNQQILDKVGITPKEYPKNYTELYDQMRAIKKSGAADTPWLPRWIAESFGIGDAIYNEMLAEGLELVDEEGHPIFDGKTEHVAVLERAKKAWDDGLVPKSVLTMSETDQIDGFASGRYAMSEQQLYDAIATMNNPQRSKIAGHASFVPVPEGGHSWGHLQLGAYVVPNHGQSAERLGRAFRLAGYAGYQDNDGTPYVSKQWALANGLGSGYASVLEDPEVIAKYKTWLPDFDTQMPQIKAAMQQAKPFRMSRQIWSTEWNSKARELFPTVFTGEVTPAKALDQLREHADKLVDKYK
ncbi:ABC transporter substrate-binding protein [Micromonospora sp. NPDC049679]|uniref:ABC transporter substrate-binding protein n=1 Tax=Micromonospora sp. NPDC049679 TaxID=3155920 RepID=UPI0034058E5E